MATVVIHHNDLDGRCSAALLYLYADDCYEARFVEVNYGCGDSIAEIEGTINKEDIVYMVDFSLSPERMLALAQREQFTWIDHHRTAMVPELTHLEGMRSEGLAACELTWMYLKGDGPMPEIVRYLGRYDVWDQSREWEEILCVQAGLSIKDTTPTSRYWVDWIFEAEEQMGFGISCLDYLMRVGSSLLEYKRRQNERQMESAFEVEFEGLRVLALNSTGKGSQRFKSRADPSRHDALLAYHWDGKMWNYSFYGVEGGKDIDLSIIAKKYGGGGHPKACGWRSEELPALLGKGAHPYAIATYE